MAYPMETAPSVSFVEAGRRYVKKAFDFKTRARRREYWLGGLFVGLVNAGAAVLVALAGLLGDVGAVIAGILGIAQLGWGLFCVIASLSLCVRRLHDTGKSGWWYLLGLTGIGSVVLLVWYCLDSTEDNQWGPNPKQAAPARVPEPARPASVPVQRDFDIPAEPVRPAAPVQQAAPAWQKTGELTYPTEANPGVPTMEAIPAVYGSLYLYSGPMAGKSFRFPEGRTITIGRSSRCDLTLPQYNVVSGTHCRVTFCKGYINITDLNSTNGTFVNGIRLTPNQTVAARNGATIYLANATCAFRVQFD